MPRVLTKNAPTFVNIYADMPVEQKNVSTQADNYVLGCLITQAT